MVQSILNQAKSIVSHPSRPREIKMRPLREDPFGEIALEESLEETPFLKEVDSILVEHAKERESSFVAMLDCSSSMSGEKHLLASIAVAVLLLEVPSASSALNIFSTRARAIKNLFDEEPPAETVLRFLRARPKGFTNLYAGLEEGLRLLSRQKGKKRKVGILATDGRYTEGKDPEELASRFEFLVVLHLHGPGSHIEASKKLASLGHGVCLEVGEFSELPRRLYEALRLVSRL